MKTKIFITTMICLLFISLSSYTAQANDSLSESIDNVFNTVREEKASVIDEIGTLLKLNLFESTDSEKNDMASLFNASYYDYDATYKAYKLPHLFITAYKKCGSFLSIVEDDYQWKVPFENSVGTTGYAVLSERDGKLAYLGKSIGDTCKNEYISEDMIRTAIKDSDLIDKPLTKLTYLQSFMYNTTFVLLADKENEYIIPFAIRPEWSPVENGKLYTAEDLIAIYYDTYDEDALSEHGDEDGGVPLREHRNTSSPSEVEVNGDLQAVEPATFSDSNIQLPIDVEESYEQSDVTTSPVIPIVAIGGGVVLVLGIVVLLKKRH